MTREEAIFNLHAAIEAFVAADLELDPELAAEGPWMAGDWVLVYSASSPHPAQARRTEYGTVLTGDELPQHRARGLLDVGMEIIEGPP